MCALPMSLIALVNDESEESSVLADEALLEPHLDHLRLIIGSSKSYGMLAPAALQDELQIIFRDLNANRDLNAVLNAVPCFERFENSKSGQDLIRKLEEALYS